MTDHEKIAYYYEVIAEIDPVYKYVNFLPLLGRLGYSVRPLEFWNLTLLFIASVLIIPLLVFVLVVVVWWVYCGGRFDDPSFYSSVASIMLMTSSAMGMLPVYVVYEIRRKHGFGEWSEFGPNCRGIVRHRRLHPVHHQPLAAARLQRRPPSQPLLDYFSLHADPSAAEIEAAIAQKIVSVRRAIAKGDVDPVEAKNKLSIASAAIREHIASFAIPDADVIAGPTVLPDRSHPPQKLSTHSIVTTILLLLGAAAYIFRIWKSY